MLSFWEKDSFLQYDYIIVGGGIVGLSTAASLLEKNSKSNVLILERGIFPTGASTKNAGFACFGSLTEILADIERIGEQETLLLIQQRLAGLQKLRKRLGDKQIDFKLYGGFELISAKEIHALEKLETVNQLLKPIFKEKVFQQVDNSIKRFGFDSNYVKHLIFNPYEGQIHTGKMMQALWQYVVKKGAKILTGCEVTHINEEKLIPQIYIKNLINKETIIFNAPKVAICTNAFTPKLYKNLDLVPGRGQVLVTEPIPNLKFKGTFHFDEGYYYFRNYENRVIFGGGRNLDFKSEETDQFEHNEKILQSLKEKLATIILPNQPHKIAYNWSGIMAFGEERKPIIKKISPNVVLGIRCNGMGVAIGSNIGEQVANLM